MAYAALGETTPLRAADPGLVLTHTNDLMRSYRTADGQLLEYSSLRATSVAALARVAGTAFADRTLWLSVAAHLLLWVAVFACCRANLGASAVGASGGGASGASAGRVGGAGVASAARAANSKDLDVVANWAVLVGFLLAFNVAAAARRWAHLRRDVVGGLWVATNDLALLLGTELHERADRPVKTVALRYCLASFDLLFASDEGACLDDLRHRGLLSAGELEALRPFPAKPQVLWVWVASLVRSLARRGRLPSRMLARLYGVCSRGRGACDQAAIHRTSQIPYKFVHLVAVLAHLTSALLAARCGAVAAAAYAGAGARAPGAAAGTQRLPAAGGPGGIGAAAEAAQQALLALAAPLFYGALLCCAAALDQPPAPPGGERAAPPGGAPPGAGPGADAALPVSAYRAFMRDECEAFFTAGENLPKAAALAQEAREQEAGPTGFVHDPVAVV